MVDEIRLNLYPLFGRPNSYLLVTVVHLLVGVPVPVSCTGSSCSLVCQYYCTRTAAVIACAGHCRLSVQDVDRTGSTGIMIHHMIPRYITRPFINARFFEIEKWRR